MKTRVRCPLNLIEGPGRIYFAMEKGKYYTADEIGKLAGIAKTTANRHLHALSDAGVLTCYRSHSTRGRPSHYYSIAQQEQAA